MMGTIYERGSPGSGVDSTNPRDLVEWLRTGRLTLIDQRKQVVPAEDWATLPAEVQAQARADFDRVVRGNAKAAVLYLR
jgi:hypothetical protein